MEKVGKTQVQGILPIRPVLRDSQNPRQDETNDKAGPEADNIRHCNV